MTVLSCAMSPPNLVTPPETYFQGLMEIAGSPNVEIADMTPGSIRLRREQVNQLGSWNGAWRDGTIPRSLDILASGTHLLPCIETDGWDNITTFGNYLADWCDALDQHAESPPIWWEIGNEPDTGGDQHTLAGQAAIRLKYLQYFKKAYDVLHPRGKKLILSAFIGATGGTTTVLNDIKNGPTGGVLFSMISGKAIHTYTQQADVDNPLPYGTTKYINTGTKQAVFGLRTLFDSYTTPNGGLARKPIFITEFGWPCATRADGLQHGDWGSGQPGASNGTTGQENRTISLALQAQLVSQAFGVIRDFRGKRTGIDGGTGLYCLGAWCFSDSDYGLPDGRWDGHCGAHDISHARRPLYDTLKGLAKSFPMVP